MTENVNTGGLKTFTNKGDLKLDEERKKDIQEGYVKYYERKAKELRNKRILLIVIGFILLALLGWAFLRMF